MYDERDRLGRVFTAEYQSHCEACDDPIVPGEDCRSDGYGGWIHADDGCERAATGSPHRDRPASIACTRCFQIPASNGACGCDT